MKSVSGIGIVLAQENNTVGTCPITVSEPDCLSNDPSTGGTLNPVTGVCGIGPTDPCPNDASCAGGDFCKVIGNDVVRDALPQWNHTYLPGNTFTSSGANNCKTAGLGDFSPNPGNADTWTNSTGSQLFTLQLSSPAPAADQPGWRCVGDNCTCTAQSTDTDGAYDKICKGANSGADKIYIYQQNCQNITGSTSPAPGIGGSVTWSGNQNSYKDPACTDPDPANCQTLYDYRVCQKVATNSCQTPKGMVENDPPQCNLTFSPPPGKWTSGNVNVGANGWDAGNAPRQSGMKGGASCGGGTGGAKNGDAGTCTVKDWAENEGSCGGYISWIDRTPPVPLTTSIAPFAANPAKPITLAFQDLCNMNGEGGCAGVSGVGTISVTVQSPAGSPIANKNFTKNCGGSETCSITLVSDFGDAGDYTLAYTVTDSATSGGSPANTLTGSFGAHVAATIPNPCLIDPTSPTCIALPPPPIGTGTGCSANYDSVCASAINHGIRSQSGNLNYGYNTNNTGHLGVIADNSAEEYHTINFQLSDQYGNRIFTEPGIKKVEVKFNFVNTTRMDQIAGTGDSVHYSSSEFGLNLDGSETRASQVTTTGWLSEPAGSRDGNYEIQVRSYAPTSAGFEPIAADGFTVRLANIEYKITTEGGNSTVGEINPTGQNFPIPPSLAFFPAATALPEAMNWDGSQYVAEISARQNIAINARKHFQTKLQNHSTAADVTLPELGYILDAQHESGSITWSNPSRLEEVNGTPKGNDLKIDTDNTNNGANFGFDQTRWNSLGSYIPTVVRDTATELLRFSSSPDLAAGTAAPGAFDTIFRSFIGYTVSGKHVRHKSYTLDGLSTGSVCGNNLQEPGEQCDDGNRTIGDGCDSICQVEPFCSFPASVAATCGNGVLERCEQCDDGNRTADDGCDANCQFEGINPGLYNNGIEIIGTAYSQSGIATNLSGTEFKQSVGNLNQIEGETALRRNLAALLARTNATCNEGDTISGVNNDTDWLRQNNRGCLLQNDGVLLFDSGSNPDVTLDTGDQTAPLILPRGVHTIVVNGGNLHIRSNLIYADQNSSVGFIVLRDPSNADPLASGNIFVYPSVTNIQGAFYAEGSALSVNKVGKLFENDSTTCAINGSAGFCDRAFELRNQLYWQGLLVSANTIGLSDQGSADGGPKCPPELDTWCANNFGAATAPSLRDAARIFDFNYLRAFTAEGASTALPASQRALRVGNYRAADGTPTADSRLPALPLLPDGSINNYAVYFEYDSRVQVSPPPLFSSNTGATSTELGL